MESIASHLSTNISPLPTNSSQVVISHDTPTSDSSIEKSQQLQPDQLTVSDEAKAKNDEDKKNIDASSLGNVITTEEAAATEKAQESDLDKHIRELSIEILELSVQIQMLQDKEDSESVKERRSLEVDLAIKKGQLEAAMNRKLEQAAAGS